MEENVQLRTFTVGDLREWLLHGRPVEGLSSAVITSTRAYAIMNNPFVTDEMQVVCCLYVNGCVAAFTAAFPEVLQKPEGRLAWWFSTLWCNPCYEGRGYGLIVVGALAESFGEGNCFDAEGAHETVEIFKMLGLETAFFPRYIHSGKQINLASFKGKIARLLELFQHYSHSRSLTGMKTLARLLQCTIRSHHPWMNALNILKLTRQRSGRKHTTLFSTALSSAAAQ